MGSFTVFGELIYDFDGELGVDGGGVRVTTLGGGVYFFVAALGAVAAGEGDGGDGALDCCVAVDVDVVSGMMDRWVLGGESFTLRRLCLRGCRGMSPTGSVSKGSDKFMRVDSYIVAEIWS